jgi:formamidopyrimidine-DNA glycosylase
MPELPEVEVVRSGLAKHVQNRTIKSVQVRNQRALRNFDKSIKTFEKTLVGLTIKSAQRRGKFLWFDLKNSTQVISAHLGMSGQMLLLKNSDEIPHHSRVIFNFEDNKRSLHFVDQRTFGWINLEESIGAADGRVVPQSVLHICPDVFEVTFDMEKTIANIKRRKTGIKQALLNQEIVSGIGNIYADEALWFSQTHWSSVCETLSEKKIKEVLVAAQKVMQKALKKGGTSFDDLYIDVNGESGYFENELRAYGREGERCYRCDLEMVREAFSKNRSSTICPRCQPRVLANR